MAKTHTKMRALKSYMRYRIEQLIEVERRVNAAELARLTGVTPSAISQIRDGKRAIGGGAFDGLVEAFEQLGEPFPELYEAAQEWARENPGQVVPAKEVIPASYPRSVRIWLQAHPEQDPLAPEVAAVAAAGHSDPSTWTEDRIGQQLARARQALDLAGISSARKEGPVDGPGANGPPRKRMGPKRQAREKTRVRMKRRADSADKSKVK